MLYNKAQLHKANDKKVMRKVKKQWVVVSMATLTAAGLSIYANSTSAHADTVTQTNTSTASSSGTSSNTQNQSGTSSNGTSSSTTTATNNVDETATYSSQMQQGMQDAYQNKGNQSSTLSGQAANYYNAAYDGATTAMNAYNQSTQGQGAGTQDYNYYGNTVSKQEGFQSDSANAQTGSNGFKGRTTTQTTTTISSANNSSTATATQAQTTQTTPTPTDGTPLNYGSQDNTNQGGADNPTDANASVNKYEATMVGKTNTASNLSVKATSPTQAVNIPTANTDVIVNERKKYANAVGLRKAYDQAVSYVLAQQGQADAESGKWTGVYAGSNGKTQDYYLNSNMADTNNSYDQAYRGAKDAIAKYFTNDSYNGNTFVAQSSTGNTNYDNGFNDVVAKAAQGIVYVSNGRQYSSIMTGSTNTGSVNGYIATGINTVKFVNDIDLTGATNGENDGTIYTALSTPSLTVDGQNHMVDFHGNNYTVNRPGTGSLDIYLQNFQTMYGANFYGAFRAEPGAVFHFSNLNYVGPQLLSSYSNDTYFSGNVNVLVPTNLSATYTSPFQSNVAIEGNGNQENLEVNNFILEPNSHYFGNTSPVNGGTNVVVTGNFTLGENSKMTLVPRGGNANAATIADGSVWGIWLRNTGASLNINKNATLNIIPQLYSKQGNIFGGAVYAGQQVNININGGALNYEGKNGISGYYNQPIDIQGSNQTQINVINGGVLQVLMDSIPDVTTYNSYNSHQSVYNGLINNVGLGNFNVGSRGNLKVGVTNSDSTYNVPYYGPININSVGSNHAIFIKSNAVQQFQTTTGTSGTGKAGNINAYTVAVKQADGTNQYLYNFTLNSGSTSYTGVDLNGNSVSGNISGNTLDISDVPAVQFVGNLTKQVNADGSTTVTGYAKLSNYKQLNGQPIYVGVATSNLNGSYNQLTQVANSNIVDTYSSADPNTYTTTVDTTNYDGGIIPISYKIASGTPTNYIGMRLHYGINSVNSVLTPQGYNTTVEGYQSAGNGKVVETSTGDMQIANGQLGNINSGIADALADSVSNSTSARDAETFNTKTNSDYLAAYSAIQAGYQAYANGTANQDYTKLASYINSSNPNAFAQGYQEAAYQAGLRDARFNQNNVTGNANYSEAQSQYNQAYELALNNPGATANAIISTNNLPTVTSNGTKAVAVTTAINDAQGALAFLSDEQAGTIKGSNYNKIKSDKSKVMAYQDAYQGYQNALSVSPTSSNPDANADKAETAGFEYAQSLINGGSSKNSPISTSDNMQNLQAGISGYNTAQAAIAKAKANGAGSSDATTLSDDKYSGDITAYKYIKSGAYAGLNNQSDAGLNTLQLVGYNAVVVPVSYKAGSDAYKNNTGSTPTGVASQSATGRQAFANGYNDSQTSFNQGKTDGLNAVKANPKTSDTPATIPTTATDANAYKLGYAGSVDGYSDGSSTSAGTQSAKQSSAQAVYNNAYTPSYEEGRQVAGGNDYVQYKEPKASDTNYTTGFNQAAQGHTDGYTDAQTQSNPTPTKSQSVPYVTGYNSGVSDEKADSTKAADDKGYVDGTTSFLTNGDVPTNDSTKSANYNSNYVNGFNLAEQGFKDAIAGTDNSVNYTDNLQKTAYQTGYAQYNIVQSQWNTDVKSDTAVSATDTQGVSTKSITNDIFKGVLSFFRQATPIYQFNSKNNYFKDIQSITSNVAIANYNDGLNSAIKSANATSDNYFTALGIKDFNDGYTGNTAGNVGSVGYNAGTQMKQIVNTVVKGTQANANFGSSTTQPMLSDLGKLYAQGYQDVALNGGAKDMSAQSRLNQDVYNQAVQDATNANLANTALTAVTNNSGNPFSGIGIQAVTGTTVYNSVQQGYTDSMKGITPANVNDANYMMGYNNANNAQQDFAQAESENLPKSDSKKSATYNGAADAINAVNTNGTATPITVDSTHSKAYVDAYNKALTNAQSAVQQAISDIRAGKAQDNSNVDSVADKAIYDNAYKADMDAYNAGVSGKPYTAKGLGQDGYSYGQSLSQGYHAAVQKVFYNVDTPNADTLAGYKDSVSGLTDGVANKGISSGSSKVYVTAYSQASAIATLQKDAKANTIVNSTQASDFANKFTNGVDTNVAISSYNAALDGYNDGVSNTVATATNKKLNQTDMYNSSYDMGNELGRMQRGAIDYVNNQVSPTVASSDVYYQQGVNSATNGYVDGKAKQPEKSTDNPYHTGYVQGSKANDGIKQAQTSSSSDTGLSSDGLDAYYGVKDAVSSVNTPDATLPSTNKNVDKNNAYQDAYNATVKAIQNANQSGLDAFASESAQPASDGSIAQDSALNAYNEAKSGYNDAKNGKIDNNNKDENYAKGVKMFQDIDTGINQGINKFSTTSDSQMAASDATAQAFSDVQSGNALVANPSLKGDQSQAQVYKDAYTKAVAISQQTVANAVQKAITNQALSGKSDLQNQLSDKAQQNASAGFKAATSTPQVSNQPSSIGFSNGYNIGLAVNSAIADQENNSKSTVSDTDSYNQAVQAYQAGLKDFNGKPSSTGNLIYDTAYNKAQKDALAAYQSGSKQYFDDITVEHASNESQNSTLQTIAEQGFQETKHGFETTFKGGTISNPTSAEKYGSDIATQSQEPFNTTITQGYGFFPNYAVAEQVSKGTDAAKETFKNNPDSSTQAPADFGLVASMAYEKQAEQNKAQYANGIKIGLSLQEQTPQDTAYDEFTSRGYNDFMTGLHNALDGGDAIENPNSGIQAGIDAKAIYDKAYAQGVDNVVDNSNGVSTQASTGAKNAVNDVVNGTVKSDKDIANMPYVEQKAYKQALTQAQTSTSEGAEMFIDGKSAPTTTGGIGRLQTKGYNDAKDGYNTAKTTSYNDLTDAQKNNSDFMNGFNAYSGSVYGMEEAEQGNTPSENADKIEMGGYNGGIDGYKAGLAGSPKPDFTGTSVMYQDAYNTAYAQAQAGKTAGYNDAMKSANAQTNLDKASGFFKKAYTSGNEQAQAEIQSALQDYKNGLDAPSHNTTASEYAINQATQGAKDFNDGKSNQGNGDTSYDTGYNIAKALTQAQQIVANNVNAQDDLTKEAQTAYENGIKDGVAGNNDNEKAIINTPRLDNAAYQAGVSQAKVLKEQGTQDFANGKGRHDGNSALEQAQQAGYDLASAGFQYGLNNPTGTPTKTDSSYVAGFNIAQSVKAVESNIENNTNIIPNDKDANAQAVQGYNDAVQAFKANPKVSSTPTNPSTPAYNQAYEDAIKHLQPQYANGLAQFDQGSTQVDTSKVDGTFDKQVVEQGFNDANAGFNAGMSKSGSFKPINDTQQHGLDIANAILANIDNAKSDKAVSTGNTNLDRAINAAKQNVLANPTVSADNIPNDIANNALAVKAYQASVKAFQETYTQGVNRAINHTAIDNNKLAQLGSSDANQAIKAGFNGDKNPNELTSAYQVGQDAKAGYDLAQQGQKTSDNDSDAKKLANQAVFDANQAQVDGKTKDVSSEPLVYQLAYQSGSTQAQAKTTDAINGFIQGLPRPTGTDSASKVAQHAYDLAEQGYNDAKNCKVDKNNTDSSYQAGIKAYADAQQGIEYAQAHQAVPTDGTGTEKLAAQAVLDGFAHKTETNPNNIIYHGVYQDSSNDDTAQQKAGAIDANSTNPSVDSSKLTPLEKASYDKGVQDASHGFKTAQDFFNEPVDSSKSANEQEAQAGAKAGYQSVIDGKDVDLSGKSDIFKSAYEKAKLDGQQALLDGQKDAADSKQVVGSNSAHDTIAKHAYDSLNAGYNAVKNGTDTSNSDVSFQKGVQLAKDMNNVVKAYETNPTVTDDYSKVADQAFNDGVNGKTATAQFGDNALAKNDIYNAIHKLAEDNAKTGASDYVSGKERNNGTSASDKAQGLGYDQAVQGLKDGKSGQAKSDTPAYTIGFNAGKAVQQFDEELKTGVPGDYTDETSHTDAKNAYQSAYMNATNNPDSSIQPSSNKPVYVAIYNEHYAQFKQDYAKGLAQFEQGLENPNLDGVKIGLDQALINQGFVDGANAFDDTMSGQTVDAPNTASQAGINLAHLILANIDKAKSDQAVSTGRDDLDKSINQAKANVLATPTVSDSDYPQGIAGNYLAEQAYSHAVKAFKEVYNSGVNTVVTNSGSASSDLAKLGAKDAKDAITAGFNGDKQPNALDTAYKAGQDAKAGFDLAQANQRSSDNASEDNKQGNTAVFDALQAQVKGSKEDISNKPLTYQLAYQAGAKQAETLANGSSDDFINGKPRPAGTDASSKVAQNSYDLAQQGYEDAKNNRPVNSDNPSYKAGYNAYKDALSGVEYAQQNKSVPTNASKTAQLAAQALLDGYANNQPAHSDNDIYSDFYAQGRKEDTALQQAGSKDGVNGNNSPAGLNPLEQTSYEKGFQSGQDGFNSVKDNLNNFAHSSNSNQADAQQGAKAGYESVLSGKDIDLTGKSDTFKNAYDKAKADGQQAILNGQNQALAKGVVADGNSAEQVLTKHAYDNVNSGFQAQQSNSDTTSEDASFQKGVELGKRVDKAIADINSNPTQAGSDLAKVAKGAYYDAINGKQDNIPTANDNLLAQSTVYDKVFADTAKSVLDGANKFVNNQPLTSGDTLTAQAERQGAIQAQAGYNAGLASNGDGINGTKAYLIGYNAGKQANVGQSIFADGNQDSNFVGATPSETNAYQGALAGFTDAISGRGKANVSEQSVSYINGYNNAYDSAISAMKQGVLASRDEPHLTPVTNADKKAFDIAFKAENHKQSEQAKKDAIANYKHGRMLTSKQLLKKSSVYRESYMKAFKDYTKKHTPKYVYNVKNIYVHNNTTFTYASNKQHYVYTKRYNSHVFRILGVTFNKNGLLRYKVGHNKFITANGKFVKNAYYKTNKGGLFKVIKPTGAYVYSSKEFTKKNRKVRLTRGAVIRVKRVVQLKGITRLQLSTGYVTSNKTFVIKIK